MDCHLEEEHAAPSNAPATWRRLLRCSGFCLHLRNSRPQLLHSTTKTSQNPDFLPPESRPKAIIIFLNVRGCSALHCLCLTWFSRAINTLARDKPAQIQLWLQEKSYSNQLQGKFKFPSASRKKRHGGLPAIAKVMGHQLDENLKPVYVHQPASPVTYCLTRQLSR